MSPPTIKIVVVGAGRAAVDAAVERVRDHEADAAFTVAPVVLSAEDARNRCAKVNDAVGRGDEEFAVLVDAGAHAEPGWLDALLAAAARWPRTVAVTSLIVDDDGLALEAGRVVWREATTTLVAAGRPVDDPLARCAGRVDAASTQSLLVRRDAWVAAGGLDRDLRSLAAAEVDLCLRWRAGGHHITYEPSSRVIASSAHPVVSDAHEAALVRDRWADLLDRDHLTDRYALAHVTSAVGWAARGGNRRVLIVDDVVPTDGMGAGFSRMRGVIEHLVSRGVRLALHPTYDPTPRDAPELGIEVVNDLDAFIAETRPFVDAIVVSRPGNFGLVDRLSARWPDAAIIYDAEAVFSVRLERQAAMLEDHSARAAAAADAAEVAARERAIAARADLVVSVSEAERAWFAAAPGARDVCVLPPVPERMAMGVQSFAARNGAVFVSGWEAGSNSPNVDAVVWFVREVLPRVLRDDPSFVVRITGGNPPAAIVALESPAVRLLGHVADLDAVYGTARLAIAPLRWGAGVKLKTIGALAAGLPVVATSVGGEGLPAPWSALVVVADDVESFAAEVLRLVTDEDAWAAARAEIATAQQEHRVDGDAWIEILDRAIEGRRRVA